ncbi:SdpI family protein [Quadrisphaera setariae]|uniref:SdpI family protein n=1 Tax=Quadrisphaera setariae TaxID=2593304 RepID=A0A5C8ZDH0_9ACTN|nr:SdpI family protein [Quadrisphaera setariae]
MPAPSTGSTPDPLIGIRTRATKSSPEAWVGGHRAALPLARTSGQLSLPFTAAVIAAVAAGASAVVPEATAAVLAAAGLLTVLGTGTAASIVADRAARRPQQRVGRQTSTEHGAECCTRIAVEPSSTVLVNPLLPEATTMRSAWNSSAASTISAAADPLRTCVRTRPGQAAKASATTATADSASCR